MTQSHRFGAMLAALLDHRALGARDLADRAGSSAAEVHAVLAGDPPAGELLGRLAPALGFHALDLYVLAGLPVPDDLAPLDAEAAPWVADTVMITVGLPAAGRRELLRLIRSMPRERRRTGFAPRAPLPLDAGPGSWLVRMLRYRNLTWPGMAKAMAYATSTYLSTATYPGIGRGRVALTPRMVTDFAALLGIDTEDLAALTGVALRTLPPPPSPAAQDTAALLWEARRLSADQAHHVLGVARRLTVPSTPPPGHGRASPATPDGV